MTLAFDGAGALDLLSRRAFDVVVLDVKMPGIDGVDTFRAIKRKMPDLPVILLTGHGNLSQAFETSREGVFDYLTKPCDVEKIAEVVRRAADRPKPLAEREVRLQEEGIELLLVDDDLELVRSLTPALERRGIRVAEAHGGEEALEKLGDRAFDVAVVDVVMPGMGGLDLLDRIQEADPRLEVVILTGNPKVGDVRRGLKEGAFDYLVKPQPVESLVEVIRSAWQRRQIRLEEDRKSEAERILAERPD